MASGSGAAMFVSYQMHVVPRLRRLYLLADSDLDGNVTRSELGSLLRNKKHLIKGILQHPAFQLDDHVWHAFEVGDDRCVSKGEFVDAFAFEMQVPQLIHPPNRSPPPHPHTRYPSTLASRHPTDAGGVPRR